MRRAAGSSRAATEGRSGEWRMRASAGGMASVGGWGGVGPTRIDEDGDDTGEGEEEGEGGALGAWMAGGAAAVASVAALSAAQRNPALALKTLSHWGRGAGGDRGQGDVGGAAGWVDEGEEGEMRQQRRRRRCTQGDSGVSSDEGGGGGGGAARAALFGASMDEIWEAATAPSRKRRKLVRPFTRSPRALPVLSPRSPHAFPTLSLCWPFSPVLLRKRGRPKGSARLSPEVVARLGDANLMYAMGRYSQAIPLLEAVIREAPAVPDSYQTLALVYDAMGERRKAVNLSMIAAHITLQDTALWRRLAAWSLELGNPSQSLYCLSKVLPTPYSTLPLLLFPSMSSLYSFWSPPSRFSPHTSPPTPHCSALPVSCRQGHCCFPCRSPPPRSPPPRSPPPRSPPPRYPHILLPPPLRHAAPHSHVGVEARQGQVLLLPGGVEPTIAAHLRLVSRRAAGPLRRGGAGGAGAAAAGRSRYLLPTCSSSLHPLFPPPPPLPVHPRQVVRRDPSDVEARWEQALLLAEAGDYRRAAAALELMRAHREADGQREADGEVCKMLARMYHRIDQSDKAIEVLQSLLSSTAPAAPLDLTAVNILAELYITKGSFQEALAVVERARASLCPGEALPVDLGAKAGTCLVRLGRLTDAQPYLQALEQESAGDCADLFTEAGDGFMAVGRAADAVRFYRPLCCHWDDVALAAAAAAAADAAAGVLGGVAADSEAGGAATASDGRGGGAEAVWQEVEGRAAVWVKLGAACAAAGRVDEAVLILHRGAQAVIAGCGRAWAVESRGARGAVPGVLGGVCSCLHLSASLCTFLPLLRMRLHLCLPAPLLVPFHLHPRHSPSLPPLHSLPSFTPSSLLNTLFPPLQSLPSFTLSSLLCTLFPPLHSLPSFALSSLLYTLFPPLHSLPSLTLSSLLCTLFPPLHSLPSFTLSSLLNTLFPPLHSLHSLPSFALSSLLYTLFPP
ncbi:unnamed protein product [Closterium sp. Naga37s-1]|nr:unnamed protein product [Closterium sp. Naga37s-1]